MHIQMMYTHGQRDWDTSGKTDIPAYKHRHTCTATQLDWAHQATQTHLHTYKHTLLGDQHTWIQHTWKGTYA